MSEVYVVRNQLGHYWGKGKAWVDGTEPKAAMQLKHEDEAVNTLFELSSKDIDLRGEILKVAVSERGEPDITPSEHLLPKEVEETLETVLAEGQLESSGSKEEAQSTAAEIPPEALES